MKQQHATAGVPIFHSMISPKGLSRSEHIEITKKVPGFIFKKKIYHQPGSFGPTANSSACPQVLLPPCQTPVYQPVEKLLRSKSHFVRYLLMRHQNSAL
jgi:hypothetical protein